MGKLEEYEKKVNILEEKFDEAVDTSEKKFEMVDNYVRQQALILTLYSWERSAPTSLEINNPKTRF